MHPSRANRNWQIFHFMSRLLWVSSQEDIYCGVKWKKSEVGRAGKKGESTGRAVQVTRSASFAWETRPWRFHVSKRWVGEESSWNQRQMSAITNQKLHFAFLFWEKNDFWCTSLLFDVCLKWLCLEASGGILALQFVKNCSFLTLTCFSWEAFMKLLILANFKNMF